MEYRVVVNERATLWYKPGTGILYREDGPAIEYVMVPNTGTRMVSSIVKMDLPLNIQMVTSLGT